MLLALTAAGFALGWAQKLPCRIHGYGPRNTYAYSRICYSDVFVAWTSQGLDDGKIPYVDQPVEYPVLLGGLMAVAALGAETAEEFFDRTSLLLLAAALVVTATTALLAGPSRAADAALVAVAPGAILHGTVNWDLAVAALAGLALLAWARGSPALAGVGIGLGAATKLYPAVFLIPLLVLSVRSRQLAAGVRLVVAAASTWLICNGVAFAVAGSFPLEGSREPRNAVLRFFVFNRERPPDWDSLWFVLQEGVRVATNDREWTFAVAVANIVSATAFALGMGAVVLLLWRADPLPRVAQGVFLATAIFVLSSKVFSPQYTIWLIPLAVLARPRWFPFLVWQFLEIILVVARFQYFYSLFEPTGGAPIGLFLAAVVARDLALVAIIFSVVRDVRNPRRDDVRAANGGDPAGGVLARVTPPAPA